MNTLRFQENQKHSTPLLLRKARGGTVIADQASESLFDKVIDLWLFGFQTLTGSDLQKEELETLEDEDDIHGLFHAVQMERSFAAVH